ncbi:MAG: hypothetical protein GC162_07235 [Planctomycetes bacterium]|nr:hypothetical protein [Planctomycetota bacterium]
MMQDAAQIDRMHGLLADWLEETLDDARFAEFESLLEADAACRTAYLRYMAVHTRLKWDLGAASRQEAQPAIDDAAAPILVGGPMRFGARRVLAIAAAVVLMATLALVYLPTNRKIDRHHDGAPASYAMLSDVSADAKFADEGMAMGSDLNGAIHLLTGRAQLMFHSTAVVDLTGPCEFEMTSSNRGRLVSGTMKAFVPEHAHGFTVDVPGGAQIVDLGTEFTIHIDDQSRTHLQVLRGKVELRSASVAQMIVAGQSRLFDPARGLIVGPERIALVNGDFANGLNGWQATAAYGSRARSAAELGVMVSTLQSVWPAPVSEDAGASHVVRLGYKGQAVSLRLATAQQVEPDTSYTIAVRVRAHDSDTSGPFSQAMQIIAHVGSENVVTDNYAAGDEWNWRLTAVPASVLESGVGQPIELRLYKNADPGGDEVWIEQVQFWRGEATLDEVVAASVVHRASLEKAP